MINVQYRFQYTDETTDYNPMPITSTTMRGAVKEVVEAWNDGTWAHWENSLKDFREDKTVGTSNIAVVNGSVMSETDDGEFERAQVKIIIKRA